jgi:phosphate butyryltransferase
MPESIVDGYIENRMFDELKVGDTASLSHTVTQRDIDLFATVTGDVNPAHVDPAYAETDMFHHIIIQSMWGAGLISAVLGTKLPGPGTIYLGQDLRFQFPVSIGDTITATMTVQEKKLEKGDVTLGCVCTNQNGKAVITGTAFTRAPKEKVRRKRVVLPDVRAGRHDALHAILARASGGVAVKTAVVFPVNEASLTAAVQLARGGEVALLMKGDLHTDILMHAVVASATGLRTTRVISHVYLMDVPDYPRPLLVTDAAINISPDLDAKAGIVQNAINLAHIIGIARPRVAILAAVETVSARQPSTLDAAPLCKMADCGQITGGVLDGPLAYDNAVSEAAAKEKGITSDVAGRADILLVPDLEAGNMLAKQLTFMSGAEAAGIVLGASVPMILTSRADSARTRMASCALAVLVARAAAGK